MKKILFFCSLLIISNILRSQTIDLSQYKLIDALSDEFYPNPLNPKWLNYEPGSELGSRSHPSADMYESSNNVNINSSSILELRVKTEKVSSDNHVYYHTSGTITSKARFRYGYFEIKAKIPNSGFNVAGAQNFWFWDSDDINNYRELDVFEVRPTLPHQYPMAQHYWKNGCDYAYNNQTRTIIPYNITNELHTYGIDWQPDYIDYYIDNNFIQRFEYMDRKDSYANNAGCAPTARVPVSILGSMRLNLQNAICRSELGIIQPNYSSGEVFQIDYFRYYEPKPRISLFNYTNNCSTGIFEYRITNALPGSSYRWSYDVTKVDKVYESTDHTTIQLKVKSAYVNQNITLMAYSTRQIANIDGSSNQISTSSSILIGRYNPEFKYNTYYGGGKMFLTASAEERNPDSRWDLKIHNSDGTKTLVQTTYGRNAVFENVLPNRTYTLSHGEYSACSPWNGVEKVVQVKLNPDFTIDKIINENESEYMSIYVSAAISNPDSRWDIEVQENGIWQTLNPTQVYFGTSAKFINIAPGKKYRIVHGEYGITPNSWNAKAIETFVDMNAGFDFVSESIPYDPVTGAREIELRYNNGVLELKAFSSEHYKHSQWSIWPVNLANGQIIESNGPLQAFQYGDVATFNTNLNLDGKYIVKHGVYTNSRYTEVRKFVWLKPEVLIGASLKSAEFSDPVENISTEFETVKGTMVYPNPSMGDCFIRFANNHAEQKSVTFMNSLGKIIFSKSCVTEDQIYFNLNSLPKGVYYIKITQKNKTENKKFILK